MHNTSEHWLSSYPIPKPDGNKYDRGVALIYGGEMTGAARLATRASQRIGAGLVILATREKSSAYDLDSVIVRDTTTLSQWQNLVSEPKPSVILIGPGLEIGEEQKKFVVAALVTHKPCVLDAGALTNFADDPKTLFEKLHSNCVLTPHEGEFQKLFGNQIDKSADRVQRTIQAAKISGCVVVLKGAKTVIAAPSEQYLINENAPPWLATAGSGDVLAGLILGLIAQKMPAFEAAAASAWLHGDIASTFGMGLIAEDIVAGIAPALHRLFGK